MNSNVMKDVVRNSLFPSADMVISMSREFGVPITQEDFDGENSEFNLLYSALLDCILTMIWYHFVECFEIWLQKIVKLHTSRVIECFY